MADNKQVDYTQLDEEQMEALRAQLRGFSTGVKGNMRTAQAQMDQVLSDGGNHSSHSDTDGWF